MTPQLCFLAISRSSASEPILAEFQEGKKVFAHRKGIDRTEKDARIIIGQWFNGDHLQPVEEAIFLTPGLLSRWLGYQNGAGTSDAEVKASWAKCSAQLVGKTIVVIRLARLCSVDMLDGDIDNSANPNGLDSVKIELRQASSDWTSVNFRIVQDIQQRRPQEVLKETWDQVLAKFTAWPSRPTENDLMPDIRWGKNRRMTLIAETPNLVPGSKCEFKIIEKDRTRSIPFSYPKS